MSTPRPDPVWRTTTALGAGIATGVVLLGTGLVLRRPDVGFILVAVALLDVNRTAAIVFLIGAGLTLPYYGAEDFGLHAMASQPNILDLAEDVRYNPFAMTMFGVGLLTMAAGAIIVAVRQRTVPAILFAVGFGLFLPQFFGPPALRIGHGVLLGEKLLQPAN